MELGEIKARFIRGIVTHPDGIIVPFDTKQLRLYPDMREFCEPQQHNEGYAFSSLTAGSSRRNNTLNDSIEYIVQGYKTVCMIIDHASEFMAKGDIWKILQDHAGRSFIHKPEISIAIDEYDGNILFH